MGKRPINFCVIIQVTIVLRYFISAQGTLISSSTYIVDIGGVCKWRAMAVGLTIISNSVGIILQPLLNWNQNSSSCWMVWNNSIKCCYFYIKTTPKQKGNIWSLRRKTLPYHTYPWLYLGKKKCAWKMTLITFLKW